jgi:hypothetical protein
MKSLFKSFLILALLSTFGFAVTPFSLEGLKEVNVVVADKSKVLKKETRKKIKEDTIKKLQDLGIKTKTDKFSNFIIKISAQNVGKKSAVLVSLFLVESASPIRDRELENVTITYKQDDFFIADNLDKEVYESAVEFLLFTFEDQYIEEN